MADEACRTSQNSLVNQLCRLVDNLREQNNTTQRRAEINDNREETVGAAIGRLFPSVNARSRSNDPNSPHADPASSDQPTTSSSHSVTDDRVPNRRGSMPLRFDPRNTTRESARRKPYSKKKSAAKSPSAAVMKDVILLPNPRMKDVPRGRTREELYVRGFVATAVSITNELTASEIQRQFASVFEQKLRGRPFSIVRAVGNEIVDINLPQEINGKILKHICGQGPVYLRCLRPTDTLYKWVDEEESEEENVTDESEDSDLPESGISSDILTPSCSTSIVCESNTSSEPAIGIASQSHTTSTSTNTGSVACPTCHIKFPLAEIAQHADQCCEINSREASLYRSWVLDSIDLTHDDMPDIYTSPQEDDLPVNTASTKELIETIMSNVSDETQLVSIRRKFIWEDYVNCRKKRWFKTNARLHVNFIGEEAVDGGGPRREFFTGTYCKSLGKYNCYSIKKTKYNLYDTEEKYLNSVEYISNKITFTPTE